MQTNPTPDALVERLLSMYSHRGDGIPTQYVNPDGPEAAAALTARDEQIAGLTLALREAEQTLTCGIDRSNTCYCPNCDTSFFRIREVIRTALEKANG